MIASLPAQPPRVIGTPYGFCLYWPSISARYLRTYGTSFSLYSGPKNGIARTAAAMLNPGARSSAGQTSSWKRSAYGFSFVAISSCSVEPSSAPWRNIASKPVSGAGAGALVVPGLPRRRQALGGERVVVAAQRAAGRGQRGARGVVRGRRLLA